MTRRCGYQIAPTVQCEADAKWLVAPMEQVPEDPTDEDGLPACTDHVGYVLAGPSVVCPVDELDEGEPTSPSIPVAVEA